MCIPSDGLSEFFPLNMNFFLLYPKSGWFAPCWLAMGNVCQTILVSFFKDILRGWRTYAPDCNAQNFKTIPKQETAGKGLKLDHRLSGGRKI